MAKTKKKIYVDNVVELEKQSVERSLTQEEWSELKAIDQEMILLKFGVSDATLAKKQAEDKLLQSIEELTKKQEFFIKRVREIAVVHDIEPGNPKAGNWSLDMTVGKFTNEE